MCCEGKCFGFINVETGSLIFGVFNAVIWAISIVGSVIGLIAANVYYNQPYFKVQAGDFKIQSNYGNDLDVGFGDYRINTGPLDSSSADRQKAIFIYNTVCGSLLAVGLLNFLFAVLLCNGVNKRNTAQIKAYFIYGIVITVLSSVVVIMFGAVCSFLLIILGIPIVIYGFILHMINLTIKKFSSGSIYGFNHKLLVETHSVPLSP